MVGAGPGGFLKGVRTFGNGQVGKRQPVLKVILGDMVDLAGLGILVF